MFSIFCLLLDIFFTLLSKCCPYLGFHFSILSMVCTHTQFTSNFVSLGDDPLGLGSCLNAYTLDLGRSLCSGYVCTNWKRFGLYLDGHVLTFSYFPWVVFFSFLCSFTLTSLFFNYCGVTIMLLFDLMGFLTLSEFLSFWILKHVSVLRLLQIIRYFTFMNICFQGAEFLC